MLIKSTSNKEGVSSAVKDKILLDMSIQAQSGEAKAIFTDLVALLGEEKFSIVIKYMMSEVAFKLITDIDSPLLSAFDATLVAIFEETEALKASYEQVMDEMKKDLANSTSLNAALASKLNSLNSALASVRKRLKCEGIKNELTAARELAKRSSLGNTERSIVELADCIKDSLTSLKGI